MSQDEPNAGGAPASRGGSPREEEVRLRVGRYLRSLSERMDAPSFALLLKVLAGVNAAFARRNENVELELTEDERALYTPELQRELVTLLELASIPRQRLLLEDRTLPDPPAE